jgi:hypothetical protein
MKEFRGLGFGLGEPYGEFGENGDCEYPDPYFEYSSPFGEDPYRAL